jgi:hypothetical protein
MLNSKLDKSRTERGAALTEFTAAFVVLVIFFFIPLVNMSFIGVRFFIAQGAVQEFVHRLALAEKRSDSYNTMSSDSWWSDFSKNCGLQIGSTKLDMIVSATNTADQVRLAQGQPVPPEYLPGGAKAPCIYTYELSVDINIPPIYAGGPSIPGITTPIPLKLAGRSAWENLSRDPATTEYYINE